MTRMSQVCCYPNLVYQDPHFIAIYDVAWYKPQHSVPFDFVSFAQLAGKPPRRLGSSIFTFLETL